jgi:hypothetical protein
MKAVIEVRNRDGSSVRFEYRTVSTPDGRFELRVPQPSGALPNPEWIAGRYAIAGCRIAVTEEQVRTGQEVRAACDVRRTAAEEAGANGPALARH